MLNLFSRLLTGGADKQLKEFEKVVVQINDLEPRFVDMSDEELKEQTEKFRARLAEGETLDDLLPEAFATVREASKRTLGMRHFDVQLIGGMALHRGMIAEMKTGEGKTLVSTLAGYLNALAGEGVHIVTVNDYLAKRDSEWMGRVYEFLGMKVGLIQNGMRNAAKKPAYEADVTYGTNSEFGFDYLRDNMAYRADARIQRGHHYAIVDEVDSILIDEARTPLIISGQGDKSSSTYKDFARAVRGLTADVDYEYDEAKRSIAATEEGLKKIEASLGIDDIYADLSGSLVNHLQQALKAQYMFHRDQQYVVVDGEVKIVDDFTGRILEGRRYSDGLHQAIEAKEGVFIREENQTLATITLQNYFRLYDKLSGMTGTAMTEDGEFREIYNLPVQAIPPNKPVIRVDHDDLVYQTIDNKFNAVVEDVIARHAKGQPCLVGTVSIESSEKLSRLLNKRGIAHEVLNAKHHEREAQIVAQAGREGAVTIATNMAGRGTDILLGGNPEDLATEMMLKDGITPEDEDWSQRGAYLKRAEEQCALEREHVVAAGGLCVIGTERHESRRIDNQLRGRSGRQGDPGETQFYLSLDDDLMRLFGGDRMAKISDMMTRYDMPADVPLQAKMVTKAVESAQRKVEEINFSMRKNVLDYDDVMNKQREVIYEERNNILDGKDLSQRITEIIYATSVRRVAEFCPEGAGFDEWDVAGLSRWVESVVGRDDVPQVDDGMDQGEVTDLVNQYIVTCYEQKTDVLSQEIMASLSARAMLMVIDKRWKAYLQEMDYLKTGIGLRGFGQRDPLVEYRAEAYAAFSSLVNTMYEDFLCTILRINILPPTAVQPAAEASDELSNVNYSGPTEVDGDRGGARAVAAASKAPSATAQAADSKPMTYKKAEDPDPYVGVGRNELCPCGSGKKFKHCHGRGL